MCFHKETFSRLCCPKFPASAATQATTAIPNDGGCGYGTAGRPSGRGCSHMHRRRLGKPLSSSPPPYFSRWKASVPRTRAVVMGPLIRSELPHRYLFIVSAPTRAVLFSSSFISAFLKHIVVGLGRCKNVPLALPSRLEIVFSF